MARPISSDTIEQIKTLFRYDPETGKCFWRTNFRFPSMVGKEAGSLKNNGRYLVSIGRRYFPRSRIAYILMENRVPDLVDHINGIPSDDRWSNLREVNSAQNRWNVEIRPTPAGLPQGVTKLKSGHFKARLMCNGKRYSVYYFSTAEEAAAAIADLRARLCGEFLRGVS